MTHLAETRHVIGVDAGGTCTRALSANSAGEVLGTGRSGGANPNAQPPEEAAAHITEAMTKAMAGLASEATSACVVAMAGRSKLNDPTVAAVFEEAWRGIGLHAVVQVVSDAEAAFASATTAPDGTVLIAGTGSIAGRIRHRHLVATTGGYGWLLGDEGSAFWLGREAVRATLAAIGAGRELVGLPSAILTEALGISVRGGLAEAERLALSRQLITRANAESPIELARFAPLVSAADLAGEPVAQEITTRAAKLLVANALACREPGERTPVVLVGSVLGENSPVGTRVRARLAGFDVLTSSDGVLGATWLAAVAAFGENATAPKP